MKILPSEVPAPVSHPGARPSDASERARSGPARAAYRHRPDQPRLLCAAALSALAASWACETPAPPSGHATIANVAGGVSDVPGCQRLDDVRFALDFDDPLEWNATETCLGSDVGPATPCEPPATSPVREGHTGRALWLSSGYARAPLSEVLDLDTGTMAMWVGSVDYLGDSNQEFRLIDSDTNGSGWRFYLGRHPSPNLPNRLQFNATSELGGGVNIWASIEHWGPGQWHHVAITWNDSEVVLYLDGQAAASTARPATFPGAAATPDSLYLLGSNRTGNTFAATGSFALDSLRSYTGALPPRRIEMLASDSRAVLRYELGFDRPEEWHERGVCHAPALTQPCSPDIPASIHVPAIRGDGARLTGGYLRTASSAVLDLQRGAVGMWVGSKTFDGSAATDFRLIDSDNDGSGWRFYMGRGLPQHKAHHLQFHATTAVGQGISLFADIEAWRPGDWHHVLISWDDDTVTLRVDGEVVDETSRTASFPATTAGADSLYFLGSARSPDNSLAAGGEFVIDDVRSYAGAVSGSQAAELAAPVERPRLARVSFDDGGVVAGPSIEYQQYAGGPTSDIPTAALVRGRGARAALLTEGFLRAPADELLALEEGGLAMWVAPETYVGPADTPVPFRLIDSDRDEHGWRFYLGSSLTPSKPGHLQFHATAEHAARPVVSLFAPITDWLPGEWHHVAVTWSKTHLRLFLDGALVTEAPRPASFPGPGSAPPHLYLLGSGRVGNSMNADNRFRLATFETFDGAPTPGQIAAQLSADITKTSALRAGNAAFALAGGDDGFGLIQLTDTADCRAPVRNHYSRALWTVVLEDPQDPARTLSIDNTATARADVTRSDSEEVVTLSWTGMALPDADMTLDAAAPNNQLDVRVTLALDRTNDQLRARIRAEATGGAWRIASITFPDVRGVRPSGEDQGYLVVPSGSLGQRISAPLDSKGRLPLVGHYPSRGMTMQWLSVHSTESRALYIATHDHHGWMKTFTVDAERATASAEPALAISTTTLIPRSDGSIELPWDTVIALQAGDWFDAALRYRRDFALADDRFGAPIAERPDFPAWLRDGGLIASSAGSDSAKTIADAFLEDGVFIAHRARWDEANNNAGYTTQTLVNDTPFLHPKSLDDQISSRYPTALYFEPATWDLSYDCVVEGAACGSHPPWAGVVDPQAVMIRSPDGSPLLRAPEFACEIEGMGPFAEPCVRDYQICPSHADWQQLLSTQLGNFFGAGVTPPIDGYYIDVLSAQTPKPCFATDHGHPPGGGDYWVRGNRQILTLIRAALYNHTSNPGLYGESFNESYLGALDGFLMFDGPNPEPLPLSAAVYHDRAIMAGISTSTLDGLAGGVAKQALLFNAGGIPGFWRFSILAQSHSALRGYLYDLARLRRAHLPHLADGEMLRPPEVRNASGATSAPSPSNNDAGTLLGTHQVPVAEADDQNEIFPMDLPVVLSSAWRASDGTVLVVLLSTSDTPQELFVELDRQALGLPASGSSYRWQSRSLASDTPQGFGSAKGLTATIPPYGALLVTLSP